MINILVTGSQGQLGLEIREIAKNYEYNFFFTDRSSLDISSEQAIEKYVQTNSIHTIINCAAYTAVDKAEDDIENADKINHLAVRYLAQIAKGNNIQLIHVSTDYIFDGTSHIPYTEDHKTSPNGVYGSTKLAGEIAIQEVNPKNSIVLRTSWVYSSFGNNFVKTMLRLGREKNSLGVIFDQVGTPTYARDLAKVILDILPKVKDEKVEIYNYSNEGVLSWYDFAKEIMTITELDCLIKPIETKEYPTPAKRPYYSLLNKAKIKSTYNITIPYWKDSLQECLELLGEKN